MGADAIALGIMCKAPVSGASKTRLCPPLSAGEAAQLSGCFIADVASVLDAVPTSAATRGFAVFTPAEDAHRFKGLLPAGFGMLAQRGADLGERLLHATEDLLGGGFEGVCLINSDSPTLPVSLLTRTVSALRSDGDRLVLGPAIDGGYYLIGLKRAHARLFRDIAWSTAQVLAQTLAAAAALSLPSTVLPVWYDVDDAASLQLLMHEVFGDGVPLASDGLTGSPAPHSRQYLQRLLRADNASRLGFAAGVVDESSA